MENMDTKKGEKYGKNRRKEKKKVDGKLMKMN